MHLLYGIFHCFFIHIACVRNLIFFPFVIIRAAEKPAAIGFNLNNINAASVNYQIIKLRALAIKLNANIGEQQIIRIKALFYNMRGVFFAVSACSFSGDSKNRRAPICRFAQAKPQLQQ